ncbi:MAG: hypothetical protein WD767_15245 [Alphaproteobacteria bacterium]
MHRSNIIKPLSWEDVANAFPVIRAAYVRLFVALDSGDCAAAIPRLIEAMEDVAQHHGCATIQLPESWATLGAGKYGVHAHLTDAGHDREAVRFSKILRPG